jgi:ribose 5-phosphate isomerase B
LSINEQNFTWSGSMKVAIGSDEAAYERKEVLLAHLRARGVDVTDFGTYNAQPVIGIGMAISANKVPGISAAQCHDTYSAERASRSNDAQIITIGARVVGPELAKTIVDTFLAAEFDGGRSEPKVRRIQQYETELHAADEARAARREDTPR